MEQSEKNKLSVLKRTINIFLTAIIVVLLVFSVYVTSETSKGKAVNIFGYYVLRVVTGSMEPSLHIGDCIIVHKVKAENLESGDIIAFYSTQPDINGMLVTHRIYKVNDDGSFITKGDANPISDSVSVNPENILGIYIRKAGFYKWLSSFEDSRKLIMLLIMLPTLLVSAYELKTVMKIGKDIRSETREEEYERLMREAVEKEKERLAKENYKPKDEVEKQ